MEYALVPNESLFWLGTTCFIHAEQLSVDKLWFIRIKLETLVCIAFKDLPSVTKMILIISILATLIILMIKVDVC